MPTPFSAFSNMLEALGQHLLLQSLRRGRVVQRAVVDRDDLLNVGRNHRRDEVPSGMANAAAPSSTKTTKIVRFFIKPLGIHTWMPKSAC